MMMIDRFCIVPPWISPCPKPPHGPPFVPPNPIVIVIPVMPHTVLVSETTRVTR